MVDGSRICGVIPGAADWRRADIVRRDDWLQGFTSDQIAEIDAALSSVKAKEVGPGDMVADDFPLPTLSSEIAAVRGVLQEGLGFHVFRGFPVDRYGDADLRLINWGIGLHLGTPVSQSKNGDLIGDVLNAGSDTTELVSRGYRSDSELSFHGDGCDVTVLFCLRTAKSGGLSRLASALAVHNEIARCRPDLLPLLYQPFIWSKRGEEKQGEDPYYDQAICGAEDGQFVCRYLRPHIRFGYQEAGKQQSLQQTEVLDLFDNLVSDPEFFFEKSFERGDIQFSNNLRILHSRTAFEDFPETDRRRHLLRLWLSVPNSPPLPESFAYFFGDIRAGAVRGGYASHDRSTFETVEN